MNSVASLIECNFSTLSHEEKCAIKARGRPMPPMIIQQQLCSRGKDYIRSFKTQLYERNSWICGCEIQNRLFCFPCLLFSTGKEVTWTRTGVSDLSHLTQKMKKHETTLSHKNSYLDLCILGRTEIKQQLSEAFRLNVEKNNEKVRKNRYVLSKIIDCILFCGGFELALHGREMEDSNTTGILKGLVNFSAELDSILKSHLEVSTVFNQCTSKEIEADLLECMLQVCHTNILEEIRAADFVSIITDETTDVSDKAQIVVVFRYIVASGMPVERYWTLLEPRHRDATTLFTCIDNILREVLGDNKGKLISQSYDGRNVMSARFTGVQSRVKEEYPNANLVHCYAHQLHLIIVQATSQVTQARIFFATLQEVCTFFSQYLQQADASDEIVGDIITSGTSTRWNYNLKSVLTVNKSYQPLIERFQQIEENAARTSTINQAQGLRLKLQQPEFKYWLEFFSKVLPHVEYVYDSLQKKNISPARAKEVISTFVGIIKKVRDNVDSLDIEGESLEAEPRQKRKRVENYYKLRDAAAREICDAIVVQTAQRFEFTGHLVASNLFDSDNMSVYRKKFPEDVLNDTLESFDFLDGSKLRSELQLIYSREDFKNVKKITNLLAFLLENNLEECFSETIELLKALITIPMTTTEAERCFPCLKRIKNFLRHTADEGRLEALAMLSIEKEMSRKIPDFNERVMDRFASKKERRMAFLLKHTTTVGTEETVEQEKTKQGDRQGKLQGESLVQEEYEKEETKHGEQGDIQGECLVQEEDEPEETKHEEQVDMQGECLVQEEYEQEECLVKQEIKQELSD